MEKTIWLKKKEIQYNFFTSLTTQYSLAFSWNLGLAFGLLVGYILYKVLMVITGVNVMSLNLEQVIYAGICFFVGVALFIIVRRRMPVISIMEFVSHQQTRPQYLHYLIVRCVRGVCFGLAINGVVILTATALNMYFR